MSAPFYNLLSKCDRAIVAHIVNRQAGTWSNTLPFKYGILKDPPVILVHSHTAAEYQQGSGIWTVQTSVTVRTLAADPDKTIDDLISESDTLIGNVVDLFLDGGGDKVGEDLTDSARALAGENQKHADLLDFTCQNLEVKGFSSGMVEDTILWEDTADLELVVCPKNVS